MKKGIAVALLLCLLISVFSIASAASVKLAVKGGSICLRTGPGASYSVITYLKDGQKITVESKGSIWSKVKTSNGKVGYIKNLYISGIGKEYADGTTYVATKYKAYIKTSGSRANMRAGASSSTGLITTLANGTQVTVLGTNGTWTLVSTSSGTQGFVSSKLISSSKSSSDSDSSSSKGTAIVNATGLYMREGPGTSYDIITCVRNGKKVTVLSSSGSWWLVSYGNQTGYMYSSYLKKQ